MTEYKTDEMKHIASKGEPEPAFDEKYPEAAKVSAISEERRRTVGSVIEWLRSNGRTIAEWRKRVIQMTAANEEALKKGYWGDANTNWFYTKCSEYIIEALMEGWDHEEPIERYLVESNYTTGGIVVKVQEGDVAEAARRFSVAGEWGTYPSDDKDLTPVRQPVEELVSEFFGIDYKKYQDEREAMFKEIQEQAR